VDDEQGLPVMNSSEFIALLTVFRNHGSTEMLSFFDMDYKLKTQAGLRTPPTPTRKEPAKLADKVLTLYFHCL